ncbi:MAG: MurR/RpiR family transcriptional regulator [Enterococcus sp.]
MLLLDKLKNTTNFTNNEQRIATYITDNLVEVSTMSVEELAKKTYTSHSAVVRLAKKLGYEGFKGLKAAINHLIQYDLHREPTVDANFPFEPADSPAEIAKKMADLTVETVKRTQAQMDEQKLVDAGKMLHQSQRIFLFARGDSQIRARSFQNKLVKINKFAIIGEEYTDEAWTAANLTKKDCAVIITYGAKVPQYLRILTYLKEQGIPSILLTGNPTTEMIELATLPIITTQTEYEFLKIGTFSSQIAFEYILDTLFSIMYAKDYVKNLVNLKNKHALLEIGPLSEYE